MNEPSAIVFDLFGVLFSKGLESSVDHLSAIFDRSEQAIRPVYRKWEVEFDLGNINEIGFWEGVNTELGTQVDPRILTSIVLSGYKVNRQVVSLAKRLRDGFKLAVYSNYRREWFEKLDRKFNLSQYFDDVFISSDIGVLKPDPMVFEWVCKKLAIAPGEMILIDDEVDNVESAKRFGASGVLFKNAVQAATDIVKITRDEHRFCDVHYSGVILQASNGALVLQRRDNNPAISNPGMLSVFGGRRIYSETAAECALRELEEEVSLSVAENELAFLGRLVSPIEDDKWMHCSYYSVKNASVSSMRLNEGQEIEVHWPEEAIQRDDMVVASSVAIQRFILGMA